MEIDNKTRAFNGFQAIKAGDPDFVNNTLIESFTDTLANMMHYAASQHQDFENALRIGALPTKKETTRWATK